MFAYWQSSYLQYIDAVEYSFSAFVMLVGITKATKKINADISMHDDEKIVPAVWRKCLF